MAGQLVTHWNFGGVDSRSNPLGMPPNRSLRCRNFIKDRSGVLKLRYGYTAPTMSSTDTSSAIHSAFLFQRFDDSRYVIFGQGTSLKSMQVGSAGTVSTISTLSTSSDFQCFFYNNYMYLATGAEFKFYDGTTLRDVGIRAPSNDETAVLRDDSVLVSAGETDVTGFSCTSKKGENSPEKETR